MVPTLLMLLIPPITDSPGLVTAIVEAMGGSPPGRFLRLVTAPMIGLTVMSS